MIITIPIRTVSESNQREHWARRHKRRRQLRGTVSLVVAAEMAVRGRVELPCTVTLTRHAPSSGLDQDNLVASLKAVIDGVADAFGIDDRDPGLSWRYAQKRSKPGKYLVEIQLLTEAVTLDETA